MTDKGINDFHVVSDILILSGVDKLMLYIYLDIGVGNENEPMTPKTKLGLVIFGDVRMLIIP